MLNLFLIMKRKYLILDHNKIKKLFFFLLNKKKKKQEKSKISSFYHRGVYQRYKHAHLVELSFCLWFIILGRDTLRAGK